MAVSAWRVVLLAGAIVVAGHAVGATERKPSPKFDGPAIPEPPAQQRPWTAPTTTLPAALVSAVDLLFQQGMADPRGGEYRQIEVVVGNVWHGDSGIHKVHGWVLPDRGNGARRFVVCWNGLVYPAISVGAPADLKADVGAMIAGDRKVQDDWAKDQGRSKLPFTRIHHAISEPFALSETYICATRVCLLLRLGEGKLAEAHWRQFDGTLEKARAFWNNGRQKESERDPYLSLAHEWAWMAFDRAVCAHMRADDILSLETATLLTRAQEKIEAAAAARHFPRPLAYDPRNWNREIPNAPYLGFLASLPSLVNDHQRRAKQGKIDRVLDHPDKYQDKRQRILALIRDLEENSARQHGQPGGVGLDSDPIPMAIEKEGIEAVGPLLDCLASDDRLTRAVSFGRCFHEGRTLLTVAKAAYVTLCHILQVHQFGPRTEHGWDPDPGQRAAVVAEIRTYCEKHQGLAPAERWYQILADDHAQPSQWVEAASRIVQPVDVEVRGGWVDCPERRAGEVPPIRGESLRSKRNPSVAELLAKRVPQIAASDPNTSGEVFRAGDAANVALKLARWDAKAAIPVMRAVLATIKAVHSRWPNSSQDHVFIGAPVQLFSALQNAGDPEANRDYAAWVRNLPTPRAPSQLEIFRPLWQQPQDPAIAATADWLFNDPASAWHCLPKIKDTFTEAGDLVASPLLGVPAFQKSLLANLSNQSSLSEIRFQDGRLEMSPDFSLRGNFILKDDPLLPEPGEKRTFRVCDWYALQLSWLEGSPEFRIFWPQEKRDAAMREATTFVRDWANRFAWNETQKVLFGMPFDRARMIFERRTVPATEAQVRAHTAIFSLAGPGEVRAVALEPFPTEARWTTLKRFVTHYQAYDEKTKAQKIVASFDQTGWIWQAEERFEGGQWKRYYGFVGQHIVAKVPAEEIELVSRIRPAATKKP